MRSIAISSRSFKRLYDILGKTVYDFVSHINERRCALEHLKVLKPGNVIIFDRGYFSYLLLHVNFTTQEFMFFFDCKKGIAIKRLKPL